MMRLCACLGLGLDIIEPCGFIWDDKRLHRVAMDYLEHVPYVRHTSWEKFLDQLGGRRVILLTTKSSEPYTRFAFQADDILMVGRESAGVPENVHARADGRVVIPMAPGLRSLNVALSASMVLGEALRQTNSFVG